MPLTDLMMHRIAFCFPNLSKIILENCTLLTAVLVTCCRKLHTISLNGCSDGMSEKAVKFISAGCSNLKKIALFEIAHPNTAIADLAESGHSLESIELGECKNLSSEGITKLATQFPRLKNLDLVDAMPDDDLDN